MNPTVNPRKRGLDLPESIPATEAERTEEANRLVCQLREWGDEAWKQLTGWEVEVLNDLNDGKACTRVRLKEVREAVARIKTKLGK